MTSMMRLMWWQLVPVGEAVVAAESAATHLWLAQSIEAPAPAPARYPVAPPQASLAASTALPPTYPRRAAPAPGAPAVPSLGTASSPPHFNCSSTTYALAARPGSVATKLVDGSRAGSWWGSLAETLLFCPNCWMAAVQLSASWGSGEGGREQGGL